MSGYQQPPGNARYQQQGGGFAPPPPGAGGFAPPPPPGGSGFAPPRPGGGGGFAPPPPGGSGFAPPPPGGSGFASTPRGGGSFAPPPPAGVGGSSYRPPPPGVSGFAPPPPPGGASGFAPPPPGGGGFAASHPKPNNFGPSPPPGGVMNKLNEGVAGMTIQNQGANQPPRPSHSFGPAPGGQFTAPNGPAAPPPPVPGQFLSSPPPAPGGTPGMFQQTPGQAGPPPAPSAMQPPPADESSQQVAGVNSGFYQQQPAAPQLSSPAAPGGPGATPQTSQPLFNENIDYNIKIPDHLIRFTADKIPQTAALANASKIPFGALLRPLAPSAEGVEEIATIQPGSAGIIRCKRCRTYINAFVSWSEHGRRWRCNICGQMNDCPAAFFCHLDEHGLRRDRMERPELSRGIVEFIAPAEYMVRPPQEPSYFFVIDVSATAVRSGMLSSISKAIKESLDNLPGRGRTKIGFITFDNSVHYYNLSSDLANPQMLVVSDLKELFVPLPDNLLVNLQESRSIVEAFLDGLPEMFAKNPVVSQSCLGPALKAAFTVMKQVGGKMCVFQSIMPNLGDGALKPRENRSLMGSPNEVKLLRPEMTWYKDTAIEFSRQQISVDMFLFPYQYLDLAALGELPKYTAGSLHSYVSFNYNKDGPRFEHQLSKVLTQNTAFEAVMRVRCTKGMRITNFYGNFYIRGTDLLALPNCNSDSVFGFDLAHEEQSVTSNYVTVQAALLYTSSDGERRIRVMTQALPVTTLNSELTASVDADTVCNLLSKQAVEVVMKSSIDNARMRLQQTCVDMIRAAKGGDKRTVSGYTVPPPQGGPGGHDSDEKPIPESMQLLPLYTLALMKNVAFRGGTDVHPDERVQALRLMTSMWVTSSKHFIYPRMFALHTLDENVGYPVEDLPGDRNSHLLTAGRNKIVLPEVINLSIDRITSEGVYLLDNGVDMFVWVGRAASTGLLGALFGVQTLDGVDINEIELRTSGDSFSTRIGAIVDSLREDDAGNFAGYPKVHIIREGDPHVEARFFWFMVEDRSSFQGGTYSYADFMNFVNNPGAGAQGQASAPRGAPPPPGTGPTGAPASKLPPGPPAMGMAPPGPTGPSGYMGGMSSAAPPPPGPGMAPGQPKPPMAPPGPLAAPRQPPVGQGNFGPPPAPRPPSGYGPPQPPAASPAPPQSGYGSASAQPGPPRFASQQQPGPPPNPGYPNSGPMGYSGAQQPGPAPTPGYPTPGAPQQKGPPQMSGYQAQPPRNASYGSMPGRPPSQSRMPPPPPPPGRGMPPPPPQQYR